MNHSTLRMWTFTVPTACRRKWDDLNKFPIMKNKKFNQKYQKNKKEKRKI